MKHLIKQHDEPLYQSGLMDFYFKGRKLGILDIETTGLNPARNKFILGGLYNGEEKLLHLVLAENRQEEAAALTEFFKEIAKVDILVTYNGKHFDLPFLEKRRTILSGKQPLGQQPLGQQPLPAGSLSEQKLPYDLDLYLVLNGHSPIRKFVPNLKQKTVENYMGLWQLRTDEISGGESVELYNSYEKNGDPALEHQILLHNSDDVQQLTRLLRVISKSDFHKAMYHLGFPVGPLIVTKIRLDHTCLQIFGTQHSISMDYRGFTWKDTPTETRFEKKGGSFTIRIPILQDSGLRIADLQALGMDEEIFKPYPSYSSGFLALETSSGKNYMEINQFIKSFLEMFLLTNDSFYERKDQDHGL